MKFVARRYDNSELFEYEINGDRIANVRPLPAHRVEDEIPWIAPSLVDLQVNGYGGREFSSPEITIDDIRSIVDAQRSQGIGRFFPTITTGPAESLVCAVATIASACRSDRRLAECMPAIHLEGPYISPIDGPRGAHPLAHCRAPDWDEFRRLQDASDCRIRLITLSPEYHEAPEFIRRAVESGVVVSIGHTAADSRQIRAAVDAGATLSTHLGNGAHRALRRHPNYLWDQLADDRLTAMLIVDGHHLPAEVVQTFVRAKSESRIILVSDVSSLAGLAPGRYSHELCDSEILADGRIVLAGQDQLLAGASRPLLAGIANVMRFAGADFRSAIEMASLRPAHLFGLATSGLREGDRADFVLLHEERSGDGKNQPQDLAFAGDAETGLRRRG